MKNKITGRIVAKQTASIPQVTETYGYGTRKEYGYIVVEDMANHEHIHMKVDANTEYCDSTALERGEPVEVEMERLGTSDILRAVEICDS
jgi:hypothetical protein